MIKIGSFFGVVVLSGKENKVRSRLERSLICHELSGVYTLDKYFSFETQQEQDIINVLNFNEYGLANYLRLEQIKDHVELLQRAIQGTTLNDWQKSQVHDELIRLEKEIHALKPKKQMLMLSGYLLIETKEFYSELPNYLHNSLKDIEGITKVLSKTPIPYEEISNFFTRSYDFQRQLENFNITQQQTQHILMDLLVQTEVSS